MKSNYRFSDVIEEVREYNVHLKYGLNDIVGVTIEKGLIPTIANLTQTALDKFYIVKPETFVYNPRTHGVRLGMGFNNTTNIYITSWNNVAFRIKKEAQNIVIPYYLWLFFCRPIWDRLTNFLAWGSSTIVFAWKDFLNIDIVLPSIEYQREIVSEYETLTNRIRLNNQMIQHLEATAQALYRKTFVDNIDKENLPEGWRMGTLSELAIIMMGQSPDGETYNTNGDGTIFYQGRTDFGRRFPSARVYTTSPTRFAKEGDVLLSVRAPVGDINIAPHNCCIGRGLASLRCKTDAQGYLYYQLHDLAGVFNVSDDEGTIFGSINKDDLYNIEIVIPKNEDISLFESQVSIIESTLKSRIVRPVNILC